MDEILRTHLINPDFLRRDDFDAFFEARADALSERLGAAMGKPVVTDQGASEKEAGVNSFELAG